MKKSSLLKMKDLYATEEMLAVAREDVPVKINFGCTSDYRYKYTPAMGSTQKSNLWALMPAAR